MWVVPSYGRPAQCARLLDQMVMRGSVASGWVAVNADDPHYSLYQAIDFPPGWGLMTLPEGTKGMAQGIREVFRAFPNQSWYGIVADDNSVETTGFERALIEAAGQFGIASGNDCWQAREDIRESRMHGAIVFGGDLIRAIGYLIPEGFAHLYWDDLWEMIGRELGIWKCLMSVLTPHNHPFKLGLEPDETTARVNTADMYAADRARFETWCREEAAGDLARVRRAMGIRAPDIAAAKTRSVLICTPSSRSPVIDYTASITATAVVLERLGIRWDLKIHVGAPINQARNEMVAQFRKTDFTDLLFIDDDMGWRPDDVLRLLASDHPIIAGVGKKRRPGPDADMAMWCFSCLQDAEVVPEDGNGNLEVLHVGTGFMRIRRDVFDLLEEAHPAWTRRTGPTAFFANDVEDGVELSEDISFCHRWRALGGQIWIDPSIRLRHHGMAAFEGNFRSLFREVEQPTAG
jgi:hypothetical protein